MAIGEESPQNEKSQLEKQLAEGIQFQFSFVRLSARLGIDLLAFHLGPIVRGPICQS
jgi:hypothetical protein